MGSSIAFFEVTTDNSQALSTFKEFYKISVEGSESFKLKKISEVIIFKDYKTNILISEDNILDKEFYTKEPLNQIK